MSKPFPVPGMPSFACATPGDEALIKLLGGCSHHNAMFTTDQMARLRRFYSFTDEFIDEQVRYTEAAYQVAMEKWKVEHAEAVAKHRLSLPREPTAPDPEDMRRFYKTGSDRNVLRHAESDGLRLIAFMSKFVEPGEDPVKLVARLG